MDKNEVIAEKAPVQITLPKVGDIVDVFPGGDISFPNGMVKAPGLVLQTFEGSQINLMVFVAEGNPVLRNSYIVWSCNHQSQIPAGTGPVWAWRQ